MGVPAGQHSDCAGLGRESVRVVLDLNDMSLQGLKAFACDMMAALMHGNEEPDGILRSSEKINTSFPLYLSDALYCNS